MAESDPKKLRPFGQPDRHSFDADEDPLIELARIVSEDGGFYGTRQERPRAQPRREEPIDRNAFSADLEAELLQELEASFASRRPTPPAHSRTSAQPAFPEPPPDEADNLLRSIEEQLGAFERRAQKLRAMPPAEQTPEPTKPLWEERSDAPRDTQSVDIGADPAEQWTAPDYDAPAQAEAPRQPPRTVEWLARPAHGRNPSRAEPRPTEARRGLAVDAARAEGPVARRREEPVHLEPPGRFRRDRDDPMRPTDPMPVPIRRTEAAAEEPASPVIRGQERWRAPSNEIDSGEEAGFSSLELARRTLSADPEMVSAEAELTRELEPSYSDPTFGGHWEDPGYAEPSGAPDEPRVAAAMIPPRRPRRGAQRRRSGKGLVTAAGVLGIIALGGAVAAYMRAGEEVSSTPPPVIAADGGAVKIETPQGLAAAEEETVGEAVYGRVAGDAPAAEEQVVEGAEEPREVARIVLPEPRADAEQAAVRPGGENEGEAANVREADDALPGPRRVRTYIVRPDGTIVQAETAAQSAPEAEEQQVAAATAVEGEPIRPIPVATTNINEAGEPETAPERAAAPAASTGAASIEPAVPAPAAAAETPEGAPEASPSTETAAAETPEAAVAAQPDDPAEAPVDLLSAAPARPPALPAEAPAAAGFVVQLSSQRSQEQALSSFADMKSRYPSVLGEYQPLIQEADLGDQGIYFRVRVGPWGTRTEAVEVCESLQAAGADCFVTQ